MGFTANRAAAFGSFEWKRGVGVDGAELMLGGRGSISGGSYWER